MGNRTVSESEIYANCRNRHEQNCLRDKLLNLSEEESNSMDLLRIEMTRWRQFRRDNMRNSGWSAEAMRPSKREPSMISLNSSSQRFHVTGTQINQFQRPWAFSYKLDSHNYIYNDTYQSLVNSKLTLNDRHRSGKSSSMSKTSTSSSTENSCPGAHRISMSQKARSNSAWTLSDNVYRCPPNTPTTYFSFFTDMNMVEEDHQQCCDLQNLVPDRTMKKLQHSRSCALRMKSVCIRANLEDSLTNATAKNRQMILPINVSNDEFHSKAADINKSMICPKCDIRYSYKVNEKRPQSNEPHNVRSTFFYHQSPSPSNKQFRCSGDIRCLCSFRPHINDHQLQLQWRQQAESTHNRGCVLNHDLFEGETKFEHGYGSINDNNRKSWKSTVRKPLLDVNSYQICKQNKNKENKDFDWRPYKTRNECESPVSKDIVGLHFSRKEEQILKTNTTLRRNNRTERKSKEMHVDPEDILASSLSLWNAELSLHFNNSSENDEINDVTSEEKHFEKISAASNSNDFNQERTQQNNNFKNSEIKVVRKGKYAKDERNVNAKMAEFTECRITDKAEMFAQHSPPGSNLDSCNTDKLKTIKCHSGTPISARHRDLSKQRCDELNFSRVDNICTLKGQAMQKIPSSKTKQSCNGKIHSQSVTRIFLNSDDEAFTRISKTFKTKSKENLPNQQSVPCLEDNKIEIQPMRTDVGMEKNIFPNKGIGSLGKCTLIGHDIKIPTADKSESMKNKDTAKPSTKPKRELISPSSIEILASEEHLQSNNEIIHTKQYSSHSKSINQTTDKQCNENKEINSEVKDIPHDCLPLTYKRVNTSVEGSNDNNTKTNKNENGDNITNNKITKNQNRQLYTQSKETTDTKRDDVYHKGVLITNYVFPEQRYKVDSRRLDLRCRSGNRSHSFIDARSCVVRVHFSKEARQQALSRLVENNNSSQGKYIQKALTESLQARIKEFCISLDAYRQST